LPRLRLERLDLEHGAVYSTLPAEVGVEVASSDPDRAASSGRVVDD
jgi:hypothetical protein